MEHKKRFLNAIEQKNMIRVVLNTAEKGVIERECVPFDFGPSRRYNDGYDRYHFFDLNSPDGAHNLSILPGQLIELEVLDVAFEPSHFVTWRPPYRWHIKRDWGIYS